MSQPSAQITTLLKAWRCGDQKALDRLTPDGQMNATALVHEAYVRLVDARAVDWQNRAHFFAGGRSGRLSADGDARLEARARLAWEGAQTLTIHSLNRGIIRASVANPALQYRAAEALARDPGLAAI
jgi:hypothetical protein